MDLMLNFTMAPLPKRKQVTTPKIENKISNDIKDNNHTKELSLVNVVKQSNSIKSNINKISKPIKNNVIETNDFKYPPKVNNDNFKPKPRSTLDLNEDASIKDMEKFLSSTKGVNSEPVFSEKTFSKYDKLHPYLIKLLEVNMGITTLTAIQEKAIPPLIEGKDVLIKSATGSGKTLSYAIPLINSLQAIEPHITRKDGIYAIIISPTQELAVQTQDVMTKLTYSYVRIVTGTLMGGVKELTDKRALRKGLNIVIATPNRLLYHIEKTKNLNLSNLKWLILDEADRMTELGFAETIQKVTKCISMKRDINLLQTVLLSATLTPGVETLAGLTLKNPFRAEVDFITKNVNDNEQSEDNSVVPFSMPSGLQHYLLVCPTKLRMVALLSFLLLKCKYAKQTGKVVVFMATQDIVEFHYQLFSVFLKNKSLLQELPNTENTKIDQISNIDIFQLHGGMEHSKRQAVFKNFSACTNGFLLATDVCARGLDMTGINWVVQYHPPSNPIDYIHRVGRTARAGTKGKALLFLQKAEVNYINHLQTTVGGLNIEKVSLRSVLQTALHHAGTLALSRNKSHHTLEECIYLTAKVLEDHVCSDSMLENLGRNAFKSLIHSYACFNKEMRQFFCYKDLHLGHVAKSMACKETPTEIARSCKRNVDSNENMNIDKRKRIESKLTSKRKKNDDEEPKNKTAKKPKLDQAQRNMLAEFGL